MHILITALIFGAAFVLLGAALGYSLVKGDYLTTGTAVVIGIIMMILFRNEIKRSTDNE